MPAVKLRGLVGIPTVLSVETEERLAWVVIDDGWGLQWDLEFKKCDVGWDFQNAVTRDESGEELKHSLDAPENLIALARGELRNINN